MLSTIKKLIPSRIFSTLQPMYHLASSFVAVLWYWFPSRNIVVIGVTGTKGKTTSVELLSAIFRTSGHKTASLSSYAFRIGDTEVKNDKKMTMPGRFFVQKFLYDAKKAGCKYVILEVTSEGIKQYRHYFINFRVAALTNIAPEHIESHGGLEPYIRAKLDLFWRLPHDGFAVINRDDTEWRRFAAATGAQKILYSKNEVGEEGKKVLAKNIKTDSDGIEFELNEQHFRSSLKGDFNLSNVLLAYTVGRTFHISPEKIAHAISSFNGVPGRMEYIMHEPFEVIVDYAHTPDSLRSVYGFLKNKHSGKLICVLGAAGGGRDKWKRPEFGCIAGEFCDEIMLTNEDPYDEDPQEIINEIAAGVPDIKTNNTKKIIDRREAIHAALAMAHAGDTVIITGKGSEPWIMGPHGTKIPWDDRGVVREEYKKLLDTKT